MSIRISHKNFRNRNIYTYVCTHNVSLCTSYSCELTIIKFNQPFTYKKTDFFTYHDKPKFSEIC